MSDTQVIPYFYRFIELQFVGQTAKGNRSDKFYRGLVDKQAHQIITWYGRNGSTGTMDVHDTVYETLAEANDALMKIMHTKMKKGYTVTRSATVTCAQKPSEHTLKTWLRDLDEDGVLAIPNVRTP